MFNNVPFPIGLSLLLTLNEHFTHVYDLSYLEETGICLNFYTFDVFKNQIYTLSGFIFLLDHIICKSRTKRFVLYSDKTDVFNIAFCI